VLVNLVGNAIEHTPAGTSVTVSLTVDNGQAVIAVCDDGPGIPAEFAPHVFERFARGETARAHTGGESGLGLAIAEAIVRAHRGQLAVESEPGRTEFTVRLPLG
jgi:two-component system OmpR family sensor kinase